MTGFAIYRLPYQSQCTLMVQQKEEPEQLRSPSLLGGKSGFVVAPFVVNKHCPLLLLHPDIVRHGTPEEILEQPLFDNDTCTTGQLLNRVAHDRPKGENVYKGTKSHYAIDFANFHAHILGGEFSKIVLARCRYQPNNEKASLTQMFIKACKMYPRMFVALFSAQPCGTWIMATPEVLLEGEGDRWLTMSLAGTMTLTGDMLRFDNPPSKVNYSHNNDPSIGWTIKNIQEQRYVSTYITECLEHFATDLEEKGPYTMRAGNLVHLRSDFYFKMEAEERIGELLQSLYPTPAVCGLPKTAARDFIVKNEFAPRSYYSGFVGPLGNAAETHLFVSLRCMRIDHDGYSLYAGGGLLADSELEAEWIETEDKMETMSALLNTE